MSRSGGLDEPSTEPWGTPEELKRTTDHQCSYFCVLINMLFSQNFYYIISAHFNIRKTTYYFKI